ncbi:unnamed protein product [Adineta ricciae]|uniref:Uncharacterized protein n=1 Tax=Adineta ricciae TaxID=249248 RepID=A0A814U0M3_ADIRI|nr:unnamed protein product [Adineta ricciae]CAF1423980.1 unnamed protein product [Adineta ricciae]
MRTSMIAARHTDDFVPKLRQIMFGIRLTDEQLRRNETIDIEKRKVSSPQNAPDNSFLIYRPSASTMLLSNSLSPYIYFLHVDGMIAGGQRGTLHFPLV